MVLNKVNMEIDEGELVAILGPNGAGKTTIFRAISGVIRTAPVVLTLLKPNVTGTITYDGERIDNLPPHKIVKKGIILCPERGRLYPQMTVLENLEMGAYLRKDKEKIKEDLEWIYRLFPDLKERKGQRCVTLSGGERQMVSIGRALMSKPKLLMLDEPWAGLAPKLKPAIFDAIKKIRKEGIAVVLVEQDVSEALALVDRAYILENGEVALKGSREELMKDPRIKEVYLGIA